MRIITTRNGREEETEVSESDLFDFPRGLLGFEGHKRFVLIHDDELAPFSLLQSLVDPWVGFMAVDVALLRDDYDLRLAEGDAEILGSAAEERQVLAVVTASVRPEDTSVNLLAPIVINRRRRVAVQTVQSHLPYSVAEPLFVPERGRLLAAAGLG